MNEDLVYGILSDEDILTDANGHETEGISTFRIESFKGKVKKEYRQGWPLYHQRNGWQYHDGV